MAEGEPIPPTDKHTGGAQRERLQRLATALANTADVAGRLRAVGELAVLRRTTSKLAVRLLVLAVQDKAKRVREAAAAALAATGADAVPDLFRFAFPDKRDALGGRGLFCLMNPPGAVERCCH